MVTRKGIFQNQRLLALIFEGAVLVMRVKSISITVPEIAIKKEIKNLSPEMGKEGRKIPITLRQQKSKVANKAGLHILPKKLNFY